MPATTLHAYFDFIDPLSYCAARAVENARLSNEGSAEPVVEWVGLELRPPPSALTRVDDPMWAERWERARALGAALELVFDPPRLVPWSRKAHELHAFGRERGLGEAVRAATFEAYFGHGHDIGRVDVLVEIAAHAGLARTETKAVLDVDRYQADVADASRRARREGVADVPSFRVHGTLPEGFPRLQDIGTLLPDP